MTTDPRRDGAKIYPFPPGGRAAVRPGAPKRADTRVTIPSGRGWYHDVAIKDAASERDHKPRS